MSNHLAIATVSAAFKATLERVLPETLDGSSVAVVTGRPELPKQGESGSKVTVFLYQVMPNPAWRNADLPTRRPDGTAVRRPQAAVDLFYLLSFFGEEKQQIPELLLGWVLRILHAEPILSRKRIEEVTKGMLVGSDLADQVESVRFVPLPMSLEELSKLWSVFFQLPYRLSVAYQASVVLIEAEIPAQQSLPVRARNLYVDPLRRPVLDEVAAEDGAGEPIFATSRLVLRGRGLKGNDESQVWIGGIEVVPDLVTDTEIRVQLAPSVLRAGVRGVQVVQTRQLGTPPTEHRGTESNAVPIVLRPFVADLTVGPAPSGGTGRRLTATVTPPVGSGQRAVLLLNGHSTTKGAFFLPALPRTTDGETLVFPLPADAQGTYLTRIQVDGAESPLAQDTNGTFSGPLVAIS